MIFQGSAGLQDALQRGRRPGPRRGMRSAGPNALQGLIACQPHSLTCAQRVMESGPSPDARAFFGLAGWYLMGRHQKQSTRSGSIATPAGL